MNSTSVNIIAKYTEFFMISENVSAPFSSQNMNVFEKKIKGFTGCEIND